VARARHRRRTACCRRRQRDESVHRVLAWPSTADRLPSRRESVPGTSHVPGPCAVPGLTRLRPSRCRALPGPRLAHAPPRPHPLRERRPSQPPRCHIVTVLTATMSHRGGWSRAPDGLAWETMSVAGRPRRPGRKVRSCAELRRRYGVSTASASRYRCSGWAGWSSTPPAGNPTWRSAWPPATTGSTPTSC
jgi:hypothetical protein